MIAIHNLIYRENCRRNQYCWNLNHDREHCVCYRFVLCQD